MTKTKIQWADHTINPVVGCSKISSGCQNCYAEKMAKRLAAMGLGQYQRVLDHDRQWDGVTQFVPHELEKPFKWKSSRSVFISSMGDLFHKSTWRCWIDEVLMMVANNSEHTFIMLTKRPERMKEYFDTTEPGLFSAMYQLSHGTPVEQLNWPLPNLVLGVSVEDQATADARIRVLLQTPAAKRFVSIEPMLEEIDLYRGGWSFLHALIPPPGNKTGWKHGIDGVVLGGESGTKARPLDPEWVRKVRDRCKEASVPFMFKQWGNNVIQEHGRPWEFNNENGFPELDGNTHTELAWDVR